MAKWRKLYGLEHATYPEFTKISVGRSDAARYFKKFARHFKVIEPRIDLLTRKQSGGNYYTSSMSIQIPKITTLDILIHEFSHHLADQLAGGERQKHNKKFKRCLKKVYTFAKRDLLE